VSLDALWRLARRWYEDRLRPGWRHLSLDEARAILDEMGLTSPFWRLAP
jgi:hypothetical protein